MAISTQTQNLNLIPGKSAPVVVHLSQGNVGDTVQFYLYNGTDPYIPSNVSIAVHGVRADGSVFGPYTVTTTTGSNLVSFSVVSAMTSVNGAAVGELVLTDSNQNQIGTANFGMLVEAAPYSSSVTYEDDLSIYQRILAYVQSNNAATNSRINFLQTEIDQIVAPTGEAPSAAEVQNARIGADGVTYSTLGEAIRTLDTDLKEAIEQNLRYGRIATNSFIQGQRLTPFIVPTPGVSTRCTTKTRFSLKSGDQISIANIDNGMNASISGIVNGTFAYDSFWKDSDFTYTVPNNGDGFYYVTVKKTSGGDIAPSEIATTTVIVRYAQYMYNIESRAIKGIGFTLSSTSQFVAPYDDCNTLPNDSVVTIIENPVGHMANLPPDFKGGTILTMTSLPRDSIAQCQIAVDRYGWLYTRHNFGNWGAWVSYKVDDTGDSLASASMFSTYAVVGDSYASGGIYKDEIQGAFSEYSWPTIFGRITGSTINNYSFPGASTRTWISSSSGLNTALSASPASIYLLCLGINDGSIYNQDSSYLGSVGDIKTDYTLNPDTFYGNYGSIIDQLKLHAPNAHFIMIAPPTYDTSSSTWQLFQTAISEIAQHYSIPCINGMADNYFNSSFYKTNKSTGHPLAISYGGMAKAYLHQIELAIQNNQEYFSDVH